VAALALMHHPDDVAPYLATDIFEILDIRHMLEVGWKMN
jgi:hypothetical protein